MRAARCLVGFRAQASPSDNISARGSPATALALVLFSQASFLSLTRCSFGSYVATSSASGPAVLRSAFGM